MMTRRIRRTRKISHQKHKTFFRSLFNPESVSMIKARKRESVCGGTFNISFPFVTSRDCNSDKVIRTVIRTDVKDV